jgi:hypothetical protein
MDHLCVWQHVSPGMKRSRSTLARSRAGYPLAGAGGADSFAGGGDDVSPGHNRDVFLVVRFLFG